MAIAWTQGIACELKCFFPDYTNFGSLTWFEKCCSKLLSCTSWKQQLPEISSSASQEKHLNFFSMLEALCRFERYVVFSAEVCRKLRNFKM